MYYIQRKAAHQLETVDEHVVIQRETAMNQAQRLSDSMARHELGELMEVAARSCIWQEHSKTVDLYAFGDGSSLALVRKHGETIEEIRA